MRRLMLCASLACALGTSASAQTPGRAQKTDAWILHVTDPHLFVDGLSDKDKQDAQKEEKDGKDDKKKRIDKIERQRTLNADALRDVLSRANTFVGAEGEPRLVLLTGDFDVDPCWPAGRPEKKDEDSPAEAKQCLSPTDIDKAQRDNQVKQLTELFAASSVADLYLLPGNNDIARELADEAPLKYFGDLIDEVRRGLAEKKSAVRLHNLAGCYAGGADSECYADIAGTPYRLVALPSHSFKNATQSVFDANNRLQEKQMEKFASLVAQARTNGKHVLVAAHVPDIDDPFFMAQDVYAAQPRKRPDAKVENRSKWSTWNVTKPVIEAWTKAVESDDVAGVLAGHLHDSHKEIYTQPYSWSTPDAARSANRKLFLAPPLAVKLQDSSPIQARGFSLVHLLGDHVERRLYWYDASARSFSPAAPLRASSGGDGGRLSRIYWKSKRAVLWLWDIDATDKPLERLAVLLIALLAAYLTVVQVWQIPPAENPVTATTPSSAAGDKKAESPAPAQKPAFEPSPFASNLGKTVLAGLGGLAAEIVLKSFGGTSSNTDKQFYIVWFIVLFFFLLVVLSLFRAAAESLRSRLAMVHYAPIPQWGPPLSDEESRFPKLLAHWLRRAWEWLTYWLHRAWRWAVSLRVPALTLFDTFINLIQGKNQTMTQALADTIFEQQRNVVRVADTIRQQVSDLIESELREKRTVINPGDVRVNISVMSADQSNVFYIAKAPGSAVKRFPKRSVAWVSVFTGKIRWYKQSYRANDAGEETAFFRKIVLFDNSRGVIANDEESILLSSHYQARDQDYNAFVVFPFPWPQRGFDSDYVKGAIHISFRREEDFNKIWTIEPDPVLGRDAAPTDEKSNQYRREDRMLDDWCADAQIASNLRQALGVLGVLLRGFNENIYESRKIA